MNNFEKLFDIRCKGKSTVEIAADNKWSDNSRFKFLYWLLNFNLFLICMTEPIDKNKGRIRSWKKRLRMNERLFQVLEYSTGMKKLLAFNYKVSLLATRS
jgi:hypothetical protein